MKDAVKYLMLLEAMLYSTEIYCNILNIINNCISLRYLRSIIFFYNSVTCATQQNCRYDIKWLMFKIHYNKELNL